MTLALASVFLPVREPALSADWYRRALDLAVESTEPHAAVLRGAGSFTVTLLGPASGIAAEPGLGWAPVSFRADDVGAFHARCVADGLAPSEIAGDATVCRFFTLADPDGNILLVVDR